MALEFYLAAMLKLVLGTFAIQVPEAPLTIRTAAAYALAASYHGLRAGVDPYELIAIAREESDFIESKSGPDGKDCGLTQTRVTVSKYSCPQLKRSYWLAFKEAAREMRDYARACHRHSDFDRCRLNHYNSGGRYAKHGYHGAYWLRVQCFAEAARNSVDVGHACRHVRSRKDIARLITKAISPKPSAVSLRGVRGSTPPRARVTTL